MLYFFCGWGTAEHSLILSLGRVESLESLHALILSLGRVESLHALIVSVRPSVCHNRKAFI